MTIRNPRRNVFWPTHIKVAGAVCSIRDSINGGAIRLFIAGNAADGWCAYISNNVDNDGRAQQVSPIFAREQGDKLSELRTAAERAYGVKFLNNRASVAEHPAESWIWQTVEAPAVIEAKAEKEAAERVASAKRRFGADVAGAVEWLETELAQELYISENAGNAHLRGISKHFADALARAIAQFKAEPVAQAAPISAADDLAFWTLEAAKRPGVPLYENLDIPADVAEDIDAANWIVGSGLKDASGRREIFRQRRAEAYAAVYPDHAAELAAEKAAQVAPFDAAKVTITRKRFSATQGEVLVEYDGKRLEQYGDNIKLARTGAWEGEPDAYWIAVAEREAVARGLASAPIEPTPAAMHEIAQAEAEEAPDLLTAVKICLQAELERRQTLKLGAPATTYTEKRIAMLRAAIAAAEGKGEVEAGRAAADLAQIERENKILQEEYDAIHAENERLKLENTALSLSLEQTERLPAPPITRAVYTVTGREADGQGGERIVSAGFNTRAEAEAYRAERETRGHHEPGKIVGMLLDRNAAAEAADETAGVKTSFFGWREILSNVGG
ncbi:hypothetical protein HF263_03040 [Rhizobium leguminosarum]|uniref:hypothetical protein n=1 Tax=Rhizobium leguminosarum TaxID=384 RepID=UPI001C90B3FE|nr:hypothetical protein [Rhizobium leguminosarum]MBY3055054.1 hypothetical protein [Rhizobium leguminosarum]